MLTSFFSNFVVEFYVDFDIPTDETQSYLIFEKKSKHRMQEVRSTK